MRLVEEEDQLGLLDVAFLGQLSNSSASSHIRNVEKSAGLPCSSASSSKLTTPLPSRTPHQVGRVELRLAEEPVAALRLQVHQRPQDHAGRRADTPPMPLRSSLPSSLVRCWMTTRRSLVSSNGRPRLSAQWKIRPERGLLGVVQPQHLRQQDRPEACDRSPAPARRCRPCRSTGTAREPAAAPVVAGVVGALGDPVTALALLRQTGQVALDVRHQHRNAVVRQLLGHQLEGLRLAGAGCARDQSVPVERGQRHADVRGRLHLPVDEHGSRVPWPRLRTGVPSSDLCVDWPS